MSIVGALVRYFSVGYLESSDQERAPLRAPTVAGSALR
jgi:hypothetical protein